MGWRKTSVMPEVEGETRGYRFLNRTVYMKKKGGRDMELNVSEFVDSDLRPVSLNTVEESDGVITVKVRSVPHPMEDDHYIEWVQLLVGDKAYRIFLNPGGAPEGAFDSPSGDLVAREYVSVRVVQETTHLSEASTSGMARNDRGLAMAIPWNG